MSAVTPDSRLELTLARWGRFAAVLVFAITALDWVGWATGIPVLIRVCSTWPPLRPWTALWLAALAIAILVQSGRPSPGRVWFGRCLTAFVGVTTVVVLMEYVTGRSFGMDQVWFGDAVRAIQPSLPGRSSPQATVSALLLSVVVALNGVDRRLARRIWLGCLITAPLAPFVTILAYLFGAVAHLKTAPAGGMSITASVCLLLLGAAIVLLNPALLLDHSDRLSLIRLGMILAGFPLLIGLSRRGFLKFGFRDELALTLSIATGTLVLGTAAYRLSRREHKLQQNVESDRTLLWASLDGMLDPQVLLEAVRDPTGAIGDFVYIEVNQAACEYLGVSREELLGRGLVELNPAVRATELFAGCVQCLDDGRPLAIDDMMYDNEVLIDRRRYDLRATRATPLSITLTWRDVTDRFEMTQRISEGRRRLQAQTDLLTAELRSAAEYVSSVLPGDLAGPVQVSSRYLPSQQVAGDCYDYRWVDDDHLVVYLIDVSGHGVGPALLSISVYNMLRSETLLWPDRVLYELNRRFQMDQQGGHYFTMWLGVYEKSTRTLRYASAGAPPAFALSPNAGLATLSTGGYPIGMFDDSAFSSATYSVPPGCQILLYSDGAYEFDLADGRQLSPDDFKRKVTRLAGSSTWSLDELVDELRDLTPAGEFEDDCSLIKVSFD